MKNVLMGVALATAAMGASAGGLVIGEYQLNDHPDGNQSPPPYGMRLDNVLGAGVATLSLDFHNDTVLTVTDDGGMLSINISGTLNGGLVDNMGGYLSQESYAVDFNYVANVAASGGGWVVSGADNANFGTLTNLGDMSVTTIYTTGMPETFAFLPDGHRLGDNSTWVGRGWLTEELNGDDTVAGTRDWLFQATEIPAPGSFALLGLGGLVAARRRR